MNLQRSDVAMNIRCTIISLFLVAIFVLGGCSKPAIQRQDTRPTVMELKGAKSYRRLAAMAMVNTPQSAFVQRASELYFKEVAESIRATDEQLRLVLPRDDDFPAFMATIAMPGEVVSEAFATNKAARLAGYHALLRARLLYIEPFSEKKGIWWFRKDRYNVNIVVSLEVFNPITSAKLFNEIQEETIKIDENDYEALRQGALEIINDLDEAVVDAAEDLGKDAAKAIMAQQWMTIVSAVHGKRIVIAAGDNAGIKPGDRLALIEGRRVIESQSGEKFVVPGYQIATIEIATVNDRTAEAAIDDQIRVEIGDIAIPIK